MWIPTVLTNHGVNTQSPCHIKRLLANDRFRGQRLLCQRRVVTMNFFYNLALHQRLKKCVLRARLLQELLALREPNETGAYRSQSAIATTPVDQMQVQLDTCIAESLATGRHSDVSCNITVGTFHAAPRRAGKAARGGGAPN